MSRSKMPRLSMTFIVVSESTINAKTSPTSQRHSIFAISGKLPLMREVMRLMSSGRVVIVSGASFTSSTCGVTTFDSGSALPIIASSLFCLCRSFPLRCVSTYHLMSSKSRPRKLCVGFMTHHLPHIWHTSKRSSASASISLAHSSSVRSSIFCGSK